MPTPTKLGRRERANQGLLLRLLENLRSQLTWLDLLVGAGGTITISLLLLGFRHQAIPEYKLGDVVREDVRTFQDVSYEDEAATERKREAAKALGPAVYDLDTELIAGREAQIAKIFAQGRRVLEEWRIADKESIPRSQEKQIFKTITEEAGASFPEEVRTV